MGKKFDYDYRYEHIQKSLNRRKLEYVQITTESFDSAIMLETLLNRVIGTDSYAVVAADDKPWWQFRFWANREERDIIKELYNDEMMSSLDDEYRELLSEAQEDDPR